MEALERFDIRECPVDNYEQITKVLLDAYSWHRITNKDKSPLFERVDSEVVSSSILRDWPQLSFASQRSEIYEAYQTEYRNFCPRRHSELEAEVARNGHFFHSGQLVFRGARSKGFESQLKRVVSTTVRPSMAAYHAAKHQRSKRAPPDVTIAAIVMSGTRATRGIVGPFGEQMKFGQEFELVVKFAGKLELKFTSQFNGVQIIVYEEKI